MPFVESSQSLKSKLNLSRVSNPVIIGVVAIVLIALILLGQNLFHMVSGDSFSITHGSSGYETDNAASEENLNPNTDSGISPSQDESEASSNQSQTTSSQVVIYVSGAVKSPGVYTLSGLSRVNDAINAAGGFEENAAEDSVNLARILQDGEQIAIPTQDQINDESGQTQFSFSDSEASSNSSTDNQLVNINSANKSELISLPGIGDATAEKIIASRENDGSFITKEDIKRVSGIGDKKYEAIQDLICV